MRSVVRLYPGPPAQWKAPLHFSGAFVLWVTYRAGDRCRWRCQRAKPAPRAFGTPPPAPGAGRAELRPQAASPATIASRSLRSSGYCSTRYSTASERCRVCPRSSSGFGPSPSPPARQWHPALFGDPRFALADRSHGGKEERPGRPMSLAKYWRRILSSCGHSGTDRWLV